MPPVNRSRPGTDPAPDPDRSTLDPPTIAAGLGLVALAPLGVVVLRLFPPLVPAVVAAGWLLPVAGGLGAMLAALTMNVELARGLRRGSERRVLRGVAIGLLAVGLAVSALRSASSSSLDGFPGSGLPAMAVVAGFVLLLAQLSRDRGGSRVRSPLVWVIVFLALEAGLGLTLLASLPAALQPWLFAIAAGTVAASALPGPWLAAGLMASGLAALTAARPDTVDSLPGLVAVVAGSLAYLRDDHERAPVAHVAPVETVSAAITVPAAPLPADRAPTHALPTDDDARRLARELRGTIEELVQARRTIEHQRRELAQTAAVDELTGVATRRAILERLRIEAAEARRYPHPLAVVLLDLDDFAACNRDHGLVVGDEVLREVALRLRLRMRGADALGRVGGDSFLALLPHTDETGAATFADALRGRLLARPIGTSAGDVVVRVSIGVAFMRSGMGLTDEELLAAADEALASARAAGGNRIAFDRMHGLIRLEERRADPGSA
jgi:diguanylate cyclase (GGDEF)-like protein